MMNAIRQKLCLVSCCLLLNACSSDSGSPDELDLDMREANVLDVNYDAGLARFDVTLLHGDDDETGYADWWQVETLQGSELGRRELAHAHGNSAFTRSEQIVVPQGTEFVVVRGHDQIHGYGGQAVCLKSRPVTLTKSNKEVNHWILVNTQTFLMARASVAFVFQKEGIAQNISSYAQSARVTNSQY